jgi:hypothetical protein
MKKLLSDLWKLVLINIIGFIGSIIAGLLMHGGNIFDTQSVGFEYYIVFGYSTSLVFAFYHIWGLIPTIDAALGVSLVLFVIVALFVPFWPIINLAGWIFAVNLSVVFLAFLFERKLSYFKQWKFIVVSIFYGALFVLLTLLVAVIKGTTIMQAKDFQETFIDGMVLGIGLGLGVEIAEAFIHSIEQHKKPKPAGKKGK